MRALWILVLPALLSPAFAQDGTSSSSQQAAPVASLADSDLEHAVRAAYNGASAFAAAHGNYFSRDDVFPPLRDAVRAEMLEEGFEAFAIPDAPLASLAAARACLAAPGAELRIVPTMLGDGVTLVAVSDSRDLIYSYDPHGKDTGIVVTAAEPCLTSN